MNLAQNFQENVTGIQHLGLPTADLNKTIAFYHSLGFRTIFEQKDHVAFLQLGTMVIETYVRAQTAMTAGAIDHVALNVKDIEAAWRDAQTCSYETEDTEIHFLPFFENGVKFFTIIGPNREKVEFNQML